MDVDSGELRRRWMHLCQAIAPPCDHAVAAEIFEQLYATYTAPDRHYHCINHIHDCLRELDDVAAQARDAHALASAIWFHDIVYDGTRSDNEQRSADVAETELKTLGASDAFGRDVRRLILLTRHDREPAPDDIDGRLIVDIDLASLALPPEEFDRNTSLIRQEYPHVSDEKFRQGRCDLLGKFLARPRIYFTPTFFNRNEQSARQNLERAMSRLSKGLAG
jgi:predicted metal-dependent HD superfamily phosphohydrolase